MSKLGGFFRDQRWRHMHNVLRSRGITLQELGHQGLEASMAILQTEGITRREALRAIGLRRRRGALASLETQGYTGEGGARSASYELASRVGVARWDKEDARINIKSGECKYPGCKYFAKITSPTSPSFRKVISAGFAGGI